MELSCSDAADAGQRWFVNDSDHKTGYGGCDGASGLMLATVPRPPLCETLPSRFGRPVLPIDGNSCAVDASSRFPFDYPITDRRKNTNFCFTVSCVRFLLRLYSDARQYCRVWHGQWHKEGS